MKTNTAKGRSCKSPYDLYEAGIHPTGRKCTYFPYELKIVLSFRVIKRK